MLRRAGLALVALGCLWIGGRWLARALASDETKIRRAVAAACEGFGDARMDPVLAVLAPEFQDATSGFTRADLRGALAAAFFQEKDPATRAFPYRAEVDLEGMTIALEAGDPDAAQVELQGRVVDTRGGGRREAWSFQVSGRMEEREQGWCFVASEHETLAGSFRLRAR